jgi:hypothetical protein
VTAAANLHELTKDADLAGFVLFGSMAAAAGGPGQGGYAAANAYLDALAEQRRVQGLAGVSIGWGPWSSGGMATASPSARKVLRRTGTRPMRPDLAVRAMAEILDRDRRSEIIADIDWERFLPMAMTVRPITLFDEIPEVVAIRQSENGDNGDPAAELRGSVTTMSEVERGRTLLELVRRHSAAVLGHRDPMLVEPHRTFRELGFDSAGSVEFRNRMIRATGVPLPSTVVFDHPTPTALAAFIVEQLSPRTNGTIDELRDPIARIRTAVQAIAPDDPARGELAAELLAALDLLGVQTEHVVGRQADAARLRAATDEEVFHFIDKEFGIT